MQLPMARDMVTHMKTTMEIADALLREAKLVARREHTTVRALVEAGLRTVLKSRRTSQRFKLRDASFRGQGLQPEFRGERWDDVRAAIYEGRGG